MVKVQPISVQTKQNPGEERERRASQAVTSGHRRRLWRGSRAVPAGARGTSGLLALLLYLVKIVHFYKFFFPLLGFLN